ncbi:MAG: TerB family tellurite resistance protein [Deltaproteobacteria bacterium]|nr:TerB family tellurite resistance protein [Deltaproteobacteria bacterium]
MKTAILADGVIDEAEVGQLRTVVYGSGGGAGARVDRAEAALLFELNNATSGKPNHASWRELFVQAIAAHVLEDEETPGVVSEEEARWLAAQIEGDGKLDDNERALLARIKANAKSVADPLKALIQKL